MNARDTWTVPWAYTKVTRPEVPDRIVPLVASGVARTLRDEIAASTVLTVVGQAGSGKSTVVAAALRDRSSVAWVKLDAGDDDLLGLLSLVSAAVNVAVGGGACATTSQLVAAGAAGLDPRGLAAVLINDLSPEHVVSSDGGPIVLVIDDVHELTRTDVLAALDHLIAYAPPTVRLVLVGRRLPPLSFGRLRAAQQLAEITGDDLRLDVTGGARILNDQLHLDLGADDVAAVVAAVGGWVTGVWLLGRSIAARHDVDGAIGSARARTDSLYRYFVEEIVADATPAVRELLTATGVLDELNPAAATALTAAPVTAEHLRRLAADLAFLVVPIDTARAIYRYHDLFASFLRQQLAESDPSRWRELNRRAASIVADGRRAVGHLVVAEEWDAAADGLERLVRDAVPHGARATHLADLVLRLPDEQQGRPWLRYATAWASEIRGERTSALALLADADASSDLVLRLMVAVTVHRVTRDHDHALAELSSIGEDPGYSALPPRFTVTHLLESAQHAAFATDWSRAEDLVSAAFDVAERAGPGATAEAVAEQLGSTYCVIDGAADRVAAWTRSTERWLAPGPSIVRLGMHYARVHVANVHGRWDDALAEIGATRAMLHLFGPAPFGRAALDIIEATLHHARGDHRVADQVLRARLDGAAAGRGEVSVLLDSLAIPLWARIQRARGRRDEVRALAQQFDPHVARVVTPLMAEYAELMLTAQVAWATVGPAEALDPLKAATDLEEQVRYVIGSGSARLDLAIATDELGDRRRADEELSTALSYSVRLGVPGLVAAAGPAVIPLLRRATERPLDRAAATSVLEVLAVDARPQSLPVPGTPIVLSAREVEILGLLATGASNRDIATGLYISEHTVKSHVRNVLVKLGAQSRSHAVARARDLRLI